MNTFLMLETSTAACSAAIADENGILASRAISVPKAHASSLAPMIDSLLKETGKTVKELSAVSVSEGPGSYTGLRVGVSTAKGVCFGAGIPLIGTGTLDILAEKGRRYLEGDGAVVSMIDARRMEVYTSVYDADARRLNPVEALVLDTSSYEEVFKKYSSIVFIGDGAEKFKSCLDEEKLQKSTFVQTFPTAEFMLRPTLRMWEAKEFQDVAYFEPFYLKDFVAGISKKTRKALFESL